MNNIFTFLKKRDALFTALEESHCIKYCPAPVWVFYRRVAIKKGRERK